MVLLLVAVLPALGLHFGYLHKNKKLKVWRRILWVTAGALCAGILAFAFIGIRSGEPHWLWQAFFPLMLGISGAEIALCLCGIVAKVTKKIPFLSRTMTCLGVSVATLTIIMVIMAYFIGNKRIEVVEYTYSSKDLPEAFDGFRIVHISDLHLGTYGTDTRRVAQLIDKTLQQKGDVVFFTGDLVNFESKEAIPFKQELSRLKATAGVYSVLGNHDYAVYRNFATRKEQLDDINRLVAFEKECGWNVLRNSNAIIERNGQKIALVGVENDGKPPFPQLADIPKAMRGLPHNEDGTPLFKIFLTHDPSHWRRAILKETDAQLTLSGHTHGMQFKIGGWSPASLVYKEWGGQYHSDNRSMIVSVGLGLGAVPFRFGVWSEVCVITLKKQR